MSRRQNIGVFFAGFASGVLAITLVSKNKGRRPPSQAQVRSAMEHGEGANSQRVRHRIADFRIAPGKYY
jgi:hypothetical protein